MDSVACTSCWRKTTHEIPCGPLNDTGVCPDCATAIAQGRDITRMTYAKHRSREREHRAKTWAATSPKEKRKAIARRYEWLADQMRTNPRFSREITECRFCGGTEPALRWWPTAFRCACGEAYVVDKWFPDDIERVHRMLANEPAAVIL